MENVSNGEIFAGGVQKGDLSALNAVQNARIKRFGEDMKGLNEFIGVLQIAGMNLKKILKSLDPENTSDIGAQVTDIMQNAQFMGVAIFGTSFSAKINGAQKEYFIDNPLALMPDVSAVKAYISEKITESNELLIELSDVLTAPSAQAFESVDVNKLTSMFKG